MQHKQGINDDDKCTSLPKDPLSSASPAPSAQETSLSEPSRELTHPPAPYPVSFGQVVEMITSGKPIAGIKEIPATVLVGQSSQSTQSRRKKPWEEQKREQDCN